MYRLLNKSAQAISEKSFSLSNSGKQVNHGKRTESVAGDNNEDAGTDYGTITDAQTFGLVDGSILGDRDGGARKIVRRGLDDEGSNKLVEFLGSNKPTTIYDWVRRGEYNDYDEKRKFVAGRIYGSITASSRLSKYISSVMYKGNGEQIRAVLQTFKERATNALFKWFVEHDDHFHVVHDCSYSNGTCRCFSKYPFDRRTRRLVQTQKLREQDIKLLINYHFEEGRRVHYLQVGGNEYTGLFRGLEGVRSGEGPSGSNRNEGHVEVCNPEDEILRLQSVRFEDSSVHEYDQQGGSASDRETQYGKRSKRKVDGSPSQTPQERLELVILAIGKVPLHDFVMTYDFLTSNWRFYSQMSHLFKNAINTVKLKFYNMRLRDYRHYYENLTMLPYWDTTTREEFSDKYLELHASKTLLIKLLIWQFAPECIDEHDNFKVVNSNWKPSVFAYMKNLIHLLDKKRGKKNTDVYVSDPNAGKTLFMDLIRDYIINCGQMANWNRNSNFPLQTCGFVRLIFWNEPNYETSVERNLLKLLGGDSLNAAIKNQMDVNISKTPVFVTSNSYPFPNKPEFEQRIVRYWWKSAPFLKASNGKKFHPFAFQWLINETENFYEEDLTQYIDKYGIENYGETYFDQINLNELVYLHEREQQSKAKEFIGVGENVENIEEPIIEYELEEDNKSDISIPNTLPPM